MNKISYHLGLDKGKIKNAEIAIVPGDPFRVPIIANEINKKSKEIKWNREYRSFLSYYNNKPVLIISSGIGGPSTSILIEELAQLGVNKFLRVGTTGAIQEYINIGDVIISIASVRLDGASTHYAPIEYPAVANFEILNALVKSAEELKIKYHLGITCSTDTFYPGQERYDTFSKYVIRTLKGSFKEWKKLNVLNYEMESSTLFVVSSVLGLKAGCIAGVVVNRCQNEKIKKEDVAKAEENAIKVAINALKYLIKS